MEERFEARLRMAETAAQLGARAHPQPLRDFRPSARRVTGKMRMSRIALRELGSKGPDPRPRQVELVREGTP